VDDYEIILVVEKSETDTLQIAEKLAIDNSFIKVLANDRCYGKGYSVRRGTLNSTGDLILVIDADLPVDLPRYFDFMILLISQSLVGAVYLTAFGDKTDYRKRGWLRAELTFGLFALRRWFLKQSITDTQLGCKLYNGNLARSLFQHITEVGFLYELQMTDMLEFSGYTIEECSVRIPVFSRESSVSVKIIAKNFITFFYYCLYIRKSMRKAHKDTVLTEGIITQ
jgi:glycosyltransferase involved in cell wall biosynthesis